MPFAGSVSDLVIIYHVCLPSSIGLTPFNLLSKVAFAKNGGFFSKEVSSQAVNIAFA